MDELDESFKGKTHAYLLKFSVTQYRNRIPVLHLLINFISTWSTPEIMSLKEECTLRF